MNIYTDLAYDMTNIKKNECYTTIFFKENTNPKTIEKRLSIELKKYLKNINNEKILVVGLGNYKSTPDSLGPNTIDKILVTGHFKDLNGYSNVSCFTPNVLANTGIDSIRIIKALVREIKATKLIVIDALKTNNMNNLVKTIQITNSGIAPGSGINNNRCEINKKTIGCDVIAIGIPTVVDIRTIVDSTNSYIVTPTNIDYLIDKLSMILANGINITLHKNIRQNNLK